MFGVNLRVQRDNRSVERRFAFHLLRELTRGDVVRRVFDEGVELFQIFALYVAPQLVIFIGFNARGDDVGEFLFCPVLLPIADDQPERFVDVVLTKRIAQINGGSIFRGFGINREMVAFVRFGRDVPFLGGGFGFVAVEKGVADPFLENDAVFLDFLRVCCGG